MTIIKTNHNLKSFGFTYTALLFLDLSASDSDEFNRLRPNRKRRCGLKVRRNEKGETQLHTACISGNTALVKRLLEQVYFLFIKKGWLKVVIVILLQFCTSFSFIPFHYFPLIPPLLHPYLPIISFLPFIHLSEQRVKMVKNKVRKREYIKTQITVGWHEMRNNILKKEASASENYNRI